MLSLSCIQQVDLNLFTVILLKRLPYDCRIPTPGRKPITSPSPLSQRQRKHGFRLPLRVTLARHHLHGGCCPGKGSLHRLNVKVSHSREDEADSGDAIVLELQRRGTHQRASTGQIVSRVILTLAKGVRECGTPKQVPSE